MIAYKPAHSIKFLYLYLLIICSLPGLTNAGSGDLDLTFGNEGKVSFTVENSKHNDVHAAILYKKTLKILATGRNFTLVRFNPDGSIDYDFGERGKVIGQLAISLAIQSDDKIVTAGSVRGSNGNHDFYIARYHSDGTPDTNFGSAGEIFTDINSESSDGVAQVLILDNGKLLAIGNTSSEPNKNEIALVRYNSDGSIDRTFGTAGQVIYSYETNKTTASSAMLQSDGKIIVGGKVTKKDIYNYSRSYSTLFRFKANGDIDESFGTQGLTISNSVSSIVKLVVQPDDKITTIEPDYDVVRYNPDGSLDTAFGINGRAEVSFETGFGTPYDLILQPDGKLVVTGSLGWYESPDLRPSDFVSVRYNVNGTLDESFGGNGIVLTDFDNQLHSRSDEANAVIIQGNTNIIAVGHTAVTSTVTGLQDYDVAMVRYTSNGNIDNTFGVDGKVVTDIESGTYSFSQDVVETQPDGKILVAATVGGNGYDFGVIRFNQDGSPDWSFGHNGKVITDFSRTYDTRGYIIFDDQPQAMAVQQDHKIVVAGTSRSTRYTDVRSFALARYTPDGSLDYTFGEGGKIITYFGTQYPRAEATGIAIQPDGKIIVSGYARRDYPTKPPYEFALARYNIDGSLDSSFGGDGKITIDIHPSHNDYALGMTLQPDDKIVIVGWTDTRTDWDSLSSFALARVNADGSLDTNFGDEGTLNTVLSQGWDIAYDVAIHNDGRIIAVGKASSPTWYERGGGVFGGGIDFAVVSYLPDGTLDSHFGTNGAVIFDYRNGEDGAEDVFHAVEIQNDGKIVAGGTSGYFGRKKGVSDKDWVGESPLWLFYSNYDFSIARFNSDGSLDYTFGDGGLIKTNFDTPYETIIGLTLQDDGNILAAGYSYRLANSYYNIYTYDLALARYIGASNQADKLESLIYFSRDFGDSGLLTAGQVNSLQQSIKNALDQIALTNYSAAIAQLNSVDNEINALVINGEITEDDASIFYEIINITVAWLSQ